MLIPKSAKMNIISAHIFHPISILKKEEEEERGVEEEGSSEETG